MYSNSQQEINNIDLPDTLIVGSDLVKLYLVQKDISSLFGVKPFGYIAVKCLIIQQMLKFELFKVDADYLRIVNAAFFLYHLPYIVYHKKSNNQDVFIFENEKH